MRRWYPWILVVVGAVALPISFAGFDQWYLTWVAFAPLFGAIDGATRRQALARGFVYGLIANMIGYYWIPYTVHVFGGFPQVLAWSIALVMCSYQGIQYALLAYLINRFRERGWSLLWIAPATMVGLETVYPLLFPIFMANTQHPVPAMIQVVELLGPLLLTAIILLFNASLYIGVKAAVSKRAIPWKQVGVGPVALALVVVYGLVRLPMVDRWVDEQGTDVEVGIVQANMGILEKWRDVHEGVRRHVEGSHDLARRGAELVIWSEAAFVDGYVRPHRERNLRARVSRDLGVPLLFGALTRPEPQADGRNRTYNSAIMLGADGDVEGTYDKTYLLAFGEYLPFGEIFPELYDYTPHTGRMSPGQRLEAVPFPFDGETYRIGVLICYEDIIPRFTRELVGATSPHLLVNMTNDAWFGDTNEPWIHMALAKFRAVEQRRYLLRATNTGVSAVIDPAGRLAEHTEVFVEAQMLATVQLLDGGPTLYQRVGDVLGYIALALLAFGLWQTRKVWLIAPPEGDKQDRRGVSQPGKTFLVVGVLDALSLVALLSLQPAGWAPAGLVILLWLASLAAMIASFVLLRKGAERGLHLGWAGCAARLILTLALVVPLEGERQQMVGILLGAPLGVALLAGANLTLWRGRVPLRKSK